MAFRSPKQKALAAEIVSRLDFGKIAAKIREGAPPDWSGATFEQIADMIYLTAETWLPQDFNDFAIIEIEQKRKFELISPPQSVICDIYGVINPSSTYDESWHNKTFVLDWKSANTLDDRWENRMRDSWQWKTYLSFTGADVFIYRGVNKDAAGTAEVRLERYPGMDEDVANQYGMTVAQIHALYNFDVWPRNMPGACGSFGRDCPYLGDCRAGSMPRQLISINSMSYSSMELFHLCPERYRRTQMSGYKDSYEAQIGAAFHRGVAELYSQVRELK